MILGIDLGKKTTGLAISSGTITQPYKTITHKNLNEVLDKVITICEEESVDTVVLGFVDGEIKKYFEEFENRFKDKNPNVNIVRVDETMTTRQANETMINLEMPKGRRKEKEHEVAAAIILQTYLNELND